MAGAYLLNMDFSAPRQRLGLHYYSPANGGADGEQWLPASVQLHPLNSAIEVCLGGCGKGDAAVLAAIADEMPRKGDFCRVELSLADIIEVSFLEKYLTAPGKLCAMSLGSGVDQESVMAVLPNGTLWLSLQKDDYETLGLQGQRSKFSPSRHDVTVDLASPSFRPGQELYNRCSKRFAACLTDRRPFIASWSGPQHTVDVSPLNCLPAYRVLDPVESSTFTTVPAPPVQSILETVPDSPAAASEEVMGLFEWFGTLSCGIGLRPADQQSAADAYTSSLTAPDDAAPLAVASGRSSGGIVHPLTVGRVIAAARTAVNDGRLPWAVVNVWGFADAPVSWISKTASSAGKAHGFLVDGDNNYSVVLLPGDKAVTARCIGSHDGTQA